MKSKHMGLNRVIAITGLTALLYLAGILMEFPLSLIFALLGLSVITTVWMVIRILKDPCVTDKTFDDYFYEDRPDLRRHGRD